MISDLRFGWFEICDLRFLSFCFIICDLVFVSYTFNSFLSVFFMKQLLNDGGFMPKKAMKPVPEGMNTVTLYLSFKGNCTEAIEFYRKAFDAKIAGEIERSPDKRILHAMIRIGDTNIMLSDAFGENQIVGNMAHMWVYVDDCDAVFERTIKAGGKITMEMADQFWGDRVGQIRDPFGYLWSIASMKWELSPEEMAQSEKEWLKSIGM